MRAMAVRYRSSEEQPQDNAEKVDAHVSHLPLAPRHEELNRLIHHGYDGDDDEAEPLPITRAAIRWLRANPPPPAQKVGVVHGDFRCDNMIFHSTESRSEPDGAFM